MAYKIAISSIALKGKIPAGDKRWGQFNRRTSLLIDSLQSRLDDVMRMPKSTVKVRALLELRRRLREVEKRVPR